MCVKVEIEIDRFVEGFTTIYYNLYNFTYNQMSLTIII